MIIYDIFHEKNLGIHLHVCSFFIYLFFANGVKLNSKSKLVDLN